MTAQSESIWLGFRFRKVSLRVVQFSERSGEKFFQNTQVPPSPAAFYKVVSAQQKPQEAAGHGPGSGGNSHSVRSEAEPTLFHPRLLASVNSLTGKVASELKDFSHLTPAGFWTEGWVLFREKLLH